MTSQHGWSVVRITLAIYLAFILVKLIVYHMDFSHFVVAGDHFFDRSRLTFPVFVEPHSDGYDGQFYYRLALDPWTKSKTAFGITMEHNPVVRVQRILYPVTVWLLSAGNGNLVPFVMVALNFAGLLLMALVGIKLTDQFWVDRRLAMLFPLFPGFILSLARDTVEIFATLIALTAVLAALRRKYAAVALLASAAVLARETTLLYMAGFGIMALRHSLMTRKHWSRVALLATPLMVFAVWQMALHSIWGSLPAQDLGPHDLAVTPFVEYGRWIQVHAVNAVTRPISYRAIFTLVSYLLIPIFLCSVVYAIIVSHRRQLNLIIPWIMYAILVTMFTGAIWVEPYGFLRVLSDFYVLGIAVLMASGKEGVLRRMMPFVAVTWVATVIYAL